MAAHAAARASAGARADNAPSASARPTDFDIFDYLHTAKAIGTKEITSGIPSMRV